MARETERRGDGPGSGPSVRVAAPQVSLPKGGGAIRGIGETFAANPLTGTAALTVPIATSPARSGFGPELALSYDSGSGNGMFGLGWSLGLPAITRRTDRGIPTYRDADESDVFVLSGAEDLVPELAQDGGRWARVTHERSAGGERFRVDAYRPRVEGLFARIERWTHLASGEPHWRSISRDNVTTLYGRTADSRIADPDDPARIFSWLICESFDDRGNAIVYEHKAEDSAGVDLGRVHERNRTAAGRSANRYLKRVLYGNRVSRLVDPDLTAPGWMFEVVLDYGEHAPDDPRPDDDGAWLVRHDPFSTCRGGFELRTYRLCQRVLMFHHFPDQAEVGERCLVRSTDFEYRDLRGEPDDRRRGHPIAAFLAAVVQAGYRRRAGGGYVRRALPALELEYSVAAVDDRVREVDGESLENLPYGLDEARHRWVDLEGDGAAGVLTEQGEAWYFKPNLSPAPHAGEPPDARPRARLGPAYTVAALPNARLAEGAELVDLAGDGTIDVVSRQRGVLGFHERTSAGGWTDFLAFREHPNLDPRDPDVRFVDLDGDGLADLLITEDLVFRWYRSLGEDGFEPARQIHKALEEELGPTLVFAGGDESIHLADMNGDGLADLVRIRNGEVCYWSSLGHGRFGPKVTLDGAPWLAEPDQFDPARVRLADIDGSGTTDVIYLDRDRVRLYFNESGNALAAPVDVAGLPVDGDLVSIEVVDLLGNGTACLVWSSTLPADARRPMRYVDLMGGTKPHLLVGVRNNLGAEARVRYAPSTRFYLQDKQAGTPWITKLPFPVHVVERVETFDFISRNRFVSRYAYHHGFFDGVEREFRGFGRVDQIDTEELGALAGGVFPEATNLDAASHVPPVLTRTWFHTGAYRRGLAISRQFEDEYYREPGLSAAERDAWLLPDTLLPEGLEGAAWREASRALRGSVLRREVYALDDTPASAHPYSVSERNYAVRMLQPHAGNRHAVLFVHAREALALHHERRVIEVGGREVTDPRALHTLTLRVDDFGDVLESVDLAYGRRHDDPDPLLGEVDRAAQRRTLVTYAENRFTDAVSAQDPDPRFDAYRAPLPCMISVHELTGAAVPAGELRPLRFEEVRALVDAASDGTHELAYEEPAPPAGLEGVPHRRLIERQGALYRRDDLAGPLPFGVAGALAIPFESYRLAFTPGLVAQVYGGRVDDALLEAGGYVHFEGDDRWWIPSGRVFFDPDPAAAPAQELALARQHFFAARRYRDPFGSETRVDFDEHDLLAAAVTDPLGNRVRAENDYRVLQPRGIVDPNGNRSRAAFDALGMVAGTAVMGKADGPAEGDSLEGFEPDLDEPAVLAHLADPLADPHAVLGAATTRLVYDVHAYARTREEPQPQPAVAYAIERETHASELAAGERSRVRHSFAYSDGFGRVIQTKAQAEPGPLTDEPDDDSEADPRWAASGWTIYDNKGDPVRSFEPFFSATHAFEYGLAVGVSAIVFYDPVRRAVATLHPDHSWSKVRFDPWRQETWDVNDTVLVEDPASDPDVGALFRRLAEAEYRPTWHASRAAGALGPQEQAAAARAAAHAATPAITHADSLGRPILAIAHNRLPGPPPIDEHLATRTELDIEGNARSVTDALGRVVERSGYNLLGERIHARSMDAGERWQLADVLGNPIHAWDSRGHHLRTEYDALRRPVRALVRGADPDQPDAEILFGRTEYGEGVPDAEQLNLRGRVSRRLDGAGVLASERYDFKGNLVRSSRQLAREYRRAPDWSQDPALEPEVFTSATSFDAMDRPTEIVSPDGSVTRPRYNEAGLLERVDVQSQRAGEATPLIADISYDAKGRRRRIEYGNGVRSDHEYDRLTFRLTRLVTRRGGERLQDLRYTYDPAGNITTLRDEALPTIYFDNAVVEPHAEYVYDAVYRLIEATGREHIGQGTSPQTTPDDEHRVQLPHPHDGQAMRAYTERYEYDAVGNLLRLIHQAQGGAWTRSYAYEEASLLEPARTGNRLSRTQVGQSVEPYQHDAHGNMTAMPHLPRMRWDFLDRLAASARQVASNGTPETTYYVYNAAGERVRKVTDRAAPAGQAPVRRSERIYLGGFEVFREYDADGETVSLERQSLHVMDDRERVALIETRTVGDDGSDRRLVRYQLGNHLGSVALELDQAGRIVSYEEYYPYGSTSFQSGPIAAEVRRKRYRYTGKERDEETGLGYHGARYYAPWLGRWTAPDPMGIGDGSNLYRFASNVPTGLIDPTGQSTCDPDDLDCSPTVEDDSSDLGTGATEEWEETLRAEEGVHEIHPEAIPHPGGGPEGKGLWESGGGNIVKGGVLAVLGGIAVSYGAPFLGLLAVTGGGVQATTGTVQVVTSPTRTVEQEQQINTAVRRATGIAASPGGAAGAVVGTTLEIEGAVNRGEGLDKGILAGQLVELGWSLTRLGVSFLPKSSNARFAAAMKSPEFQPSRPDAKPLPRPTSNELGGIGEGRVEDILRARVLSESQQYKITSTVTGASHRKVDVTTTSTLHQVKLVRELGRRDLAQLVDTINEAVNTGKKVALWLVNPKTRLYKNRRSKDLKEYQEVIELAEKAAVLTVLRVFF